MAILKRDFLPEEFIGELRGNDMQGSIAVQADQSEQETEFLLRLAGQHDSAIQGVVGWVDLCSPALPERLEHFSRFRKLCGFRHIVQSEPDDRFLLRKDFCQGIAELRNHNFTFDILIYPRQLVAAIEFAAKFPGQKFVLDHLAKPEIRNRDISAWAREIRTLAENSNVYCKLSGLVTEAHWKNWRPADFVPYLDVAFEAFGFDRLMFGSDWPVCLLAGSYSQVRELIVEYVTPFPAESQKKIFGLNAQRFYGLNS